jgi:hypothetical protein
MPKAPAHDSTVRSPAPAQPIIRVFSESPPHWIKADQRDRLKESDETASVARPAPGTLAFEEAEHQADVYQLGPNGELIDLRRCSWCDELTHSLKAFNLPKFFLIPVVVHYHIHETERNEACPGCMRWILLKYLACQIITANVLWPVVVLPFYVFYFALTFRMGHSPDAPGRMKGIHAR